MSADGFESFSDMLSSQHVEDASQEFGLDAVRVDPDVHEGSALVSPNGTGLGAVSELVADHANIDVCSDGVELPVRQTVDRLFSRADVNKALFEARLNNLSDSDLKFPWETGIMGEIFSESSDTAGIPSMPAEYLGFSEDLQMESSPSAPSTAVQKLSSRDLVLPFYTFAIRVKPDKDFYAEQEALWTRAIFKWTQVFEVLGFPGQLGEAIDDELHFSDSSEHGTVLRDAMGVKSPRTALKRAQTLLQYFRWSQLQYTDWDPWNRARCLVYLGSSDERVPASSLGISFLEALRFLRHVLQVPVPELLLHDPQLRGRAQRLMLTKEEYHPARPLRASEVATLEKLMMTSLDLFDKYMLGAVLFSIFSRSRWSDLQYIHRLWVDRTEHDGEVFGFIETETSHHKTATSLKKKMKFMPVVCPLLGITHTDWTPQWFATFDALQVDMMACPFGPVCRAPGTDGMLCQRACTSEEISAFVNRVLGISESEKVSSHSLKHTTLSWAASYGIDEPARTLLGHHELQGAKTMAVYSRDMLTRPLQLFCSMLANIRADHFRPDESRTSRLIDLMKLQKGESGTLAAGGVKRTLAGVDKAQPETDNDAVPTSPLDDTQPDLQTAPSADGEGEESDSDAVASTSSSSSDDDDSDNDNSLGVQGHIDGPVLRNRRSKVVHKCGPREGLTFCHRMTSAATFEYLEEGCSTLNARCSRCFRGEVITSRSALAEALDLAKAKRLRKS
eukprot:s3838_g6.t1